MGNSNRTPRSSVVSNSSPSTPRTSSVKSSISVKLLVPQNLAPHIPSENSDLECPICFSNYTALNTTNCCKQTICTGCFHLLQSKPVCEERLCPFCSQSHLVVTYDSNNHNSNNSSIRSITSGSTKIDSNRSISEDNQSFSSRQVSQIISIPENKKVTVPTASVNDRKSIEEQILKNQRIFREEITSSSSSFYSRSYDQYRSPYNRSRLSQRLRAGSNTDSTSLTTTGEDTFSMSRQSSSISSTRPNQSLTDRLERLLLYYNGTHPSDELLEENDDLQTNDLIMSLSDIASASSRRSMTTNDSSRLRTTSEYEARSQSSVTSSQPSYSNEGSAESIIETMFSTHNTENIQTLEELEEIMILEAMRLSLAESSSSSNESTIVNANDTNHHSHLTHSSQIQTTISAALPPSPLLLPPPTTTTTASNSSQHTMVSMTSNNESEDVEEDSIPIRIPRALSGIRMSSSQLNLLGRSNSQQDMHENSTSITATITNGAAAAVSFSRKNKNNHDENDNDNDNDEDDLSMALQLSLGNHRGNTINMMRNDETEDMKMHDENSPTHDDMDNIYIQLDDDNDEDDRDNNSNYDDDNDGTELFHPMEMDDIKITSNIKEVNNSNTREYSNSVSAVTTISSSSPLSSSSPSKDLISRIDRALSSPVRSSVYHHPLDETSES